MQSTVPGLIRIASARGSGTGVVLTPSGLALTSAQVAAGPGTVTARKLPSGHACAARIVGSDVAHDLTLLQLECGGAFQPVALGNSRDVTAGDGAVAVSASASGRSFTPVTGNVSGTSTATTIAGHRLTGLLQATARVIPGQGSGGPLVNLSGQVIGITLAGSPGSAHDTSFAMPINEALTIARQLKH